MRFSVIIPVYNANNSIVNTVESCLNQSFKDFEIIIVNDASTDKSEYTIRDSFDETSVQLINLPKNAGVSVARNTGWERAKGEYIAFLDSDDLWHQDKLDIIDKILTFKEFDCIAHSYTDDFQSFGYNDDTTKIADITFWNLIFRNYFNTSCIIIKRSIQFRFNENMRYTEDHELLIRLSSKSAIAYLNQNLTLLGRPQLSKGGLSGNKWKMRKGEMRMYLTAAKCKKIVFPFIPLLVGYSLLKHLKKLTSNVNT